MNKFEENRELVQCCHCGVYNKIRILSKEILLTPEEAAMILNSLDAMSGDLDEIQCSTSHLTPSLDDGLIALALLKGKMK